MSLPSSMAASPEDSAASKKRSFSVHASALDASGGLWARHSAMIVVSQNFLGALRAQGDVMEVRIEAHGGSAGSAAAALTLEAGHCASWSSIAISRTYRA